MDMYPNKPKKNSYAYVFSGYGFYEVGQTLEQCIENYLFSFPLGKPSDGYMQVYYDDNTSEEIPRLAYSVYILPQFYNLQSSGHWDWKEEYKSQEKTDDYEEI